MQVEIRGDVVRIARDEAGRALYDAVARLKNDEKIALSVDGVVGEWVLTDDARSSPNRRVMKPVGAMATVWARIQNRSGEKIEVTLPGQEADPWMRVFAEMFPEWASAADEEAFGVLSDVVGASQPG